MGVLPRVLLSWAFGSGVALLGIALAPIDPPHRTLASSAGCAAPRPAGADPAVRAGAPQAAAV